MDRIAVIRMLFHLLLASIIALAFPSPPYLYREKEETGLSSRLIKSRIFLCNRSQKQRKGCSAAFRYLEELTIEHKNSLGAFSFENPGPFLTRLEARLASSGVQESEWVEGALNAWLGALEPHAKLVNAKEADRAATAEKMLVQGAGAKLRFYRGKVLVGYLLDGSSAESTGLRAGDRILEINGKNLDRLNETAQRRLLSFSRPPFRIVISRNGMVRQFLVQDKTYFLNSVESSIRRGENGEKEAWLRLRSFDKQNTCDLVRREIAKMENAGAKRIYLDLRDNPGGLVRESECVASLFLGPHKLFARLRYEDHPEIREFIPGLNAESNEGEGETVDLFTSQNQATRLPLRLEINQNTASAAEMLAAALQDHRRAQILGAKSFGKGSMQSSFHPWGDPRFYLIFTTHSIFRPSGQALNLNGIKPDLVTHRAEGENFPREIHLSAETSNTAGLLTSLVEKKRPTY